MLQAEIYKKFLGKRVDVGCPHYNDHSKLFFYVGELLEANNEYILLQTNKGIRRINLSDVIEFKEARED